MPPTLKNQTGSTMLIMTLVILASMLIVTLGVSAIAVNGLKAGTNQLQSTKAYFAAEAGAERILWEIRKNGNDPKTVEPGDFCDNTSAKFCFDLNVLDSCTVSCDTPLSEYQLLENNSDYRISFKYDNTEAKPTTIKSYGNFQDLNRIIELKY